MVNNASLLLSLESITMDNQHKKAGKSRVKSKPKPRRKDNVKKKYKEYTPGDSYVHIKNPAHEKMYIFVHNFTTSSYKQIR